MLKRIAVILLAWVVSGNAAWAEASKATCNITSGTKAIREGEVVEFGDLRILIEEILHYREKGRNHVKVNISYKTKEGVEGEMMLTSKILTTSITTICDQKVYFTAHPEDDTLTVSPF